MEGEDHKKTLKQTILLYVTSHPRHSDFFTLGCMFEMRGNSSKNNPRPPDFSPLGGLVKQGILWQRAPLNRYLIFQKATPTPDPPLSEKSESNVMQRVFRQILTFLRNLKFSYKSVHFLIR